VIFTGDMSYFPNQEAVDYFARKVLPLIQGSIAEARFLIVGRNPSREVLELGKIKGVEVTGFVPDVRTYLAQSHVAVAPFSIAAGIQNKILEALAYGLPVVATPRAAQGLAPLVRGLVETGETAKELAAKTVVLLLDPALASRAGMTARTQLSLEYRWDCAMERLVDLVENLSPTSSKPALQGWPWKPNCSSLESRNPHESGS
jgi:glycosyltransferase involved in cell wall biosynthesis